MHTQTYIHTPSLSDYLLALFVDCGLGLLRHRGHGMDAFTGRGATRTRPLISCQRRCVFAALLLIVPAILATSSTCTSTSSCLSYRTRLSAMQMSRCSICDHNSNNNRSCLRLLLWHSLKVKASSVPALLSAFSPSFFYCSLYLVHLLLSSILQQCFG